MELISAVSNPKIKAYVALLGSKSKRRDEGLFVLEGLRLCTDVLRSKMKVNRLFFTAEAYEKNREEISALISISDESYEITLLKVSRI